MNDNTILRIKVPAHLYESVKEQLSLTEAKKQNYGAGYSVVKEKKMKTPKDGMKKVEEDKGYMGTGHDSSEDMAVSMIKKETKDKEMEKKTRSLEELKAAKDKLDKKIQEMEGGNENFNEAKNMSYEEIADKAIKDALKYGNTKQSKLDILTSLKNRIVKNIEGMSSKDKVEENINEAAGPLQLVQQIIADPMHAYDILKNAAQMADHEFQVLIAGLGTIASFIGGAVGLKLKSAIDDAKAKRAAKKSGEQPAV